MSPSTLRKAVPIALMQCGLLFGLVSLTAAADSFYENLLERGVADLDAGRVLDAEQKLRTACFGLLDEPVQLAAALMQLGRAQAALNHIDGLEHSLTRLVELEDRFAAFSSLDQDALKRSFEQVVRSSLSASGTAQLARLPLPPPIETPTATASSPRERLRQLQNQLRSSPNDPAALFELAQLEYTRGKRKKAEEALKKLLAVNANHRGGTCLRARLGIEQRQCAPAVAGLASCNLAPTTNNSAFLLRCLVNQRRWTEANLFLASLPEAQQTAKPVAKWARKIEIESDSATEDTATVSTGPAVVATTKAPSVEPQPQAAPKIELTISTEDRIRRLRTALGDATNLTELDQVMTKAEVLADEHPDLQAAQHLAAEVAYRAGNWEEAARFFERGGPPALEQPTLLFYMAVALFETGERARSADLLTAALPRLRKTPFVLRYQTKILGPSRP